MEEPFRIPTTNPAAMEIRIPEEIRRPRSRFARRDYILTLDPERDCQEIGYLLACYEFPWDTTRSLELALLRVFGVAKGTPLLVQTGEFLRRTQKRYDDTVLILSEIIENGYDHPRGHAGLVRMNRQHGQYTIPNDEYLYTLSTFIYEPIYWNERFGWRKLTETEKLASYYFWREIGRRMAIRDIPESYEAFEEFKNAYEAEQFRYSKDNERLAVSTRDMLLGWFLPSSLFPLAAPVVHALIDEPLLKAVGLKASPAWLRGAVAGVLRLRASLLAFLPPRRKPRLLTRRKSRTYPNGYLVRELGANPS